MVSRSETREGILNAARELLESRGFHGAGLEEVARAAGVSRQAVYLHFGSKTGLLLALVEWVDESEDLAGRIAWTREAANPVEVLERMVEGASTYAPKIHKLALALEAARRTDPAVRAAWDDRMKHRRNGFRAVVRALATAGLLDEAWTVDTATDFVWTLLSVQTFDNLAAECGWSPRRIATQLKRVAVRALVR